MRKIRSGSRACMFAVSADYTLSTQVPCAYGRDTVAYAVERFFAQCPRCRRECTWESWQLRVAKRRPRKKQTFRYLIPAVLMELPGGWVRLCGEIDAVGATVTAVALLAEHPCFAGAAQPEHPQAPGRRAAHKTA